MTTHFTPTANNYVSPPEELQQRVPRERLAGNRERLRVLMVTSSWQTPESPRATPFVVRQVEFLRRAGVDVDVFHFRGSQRPTRYLRAWQQFRTKLAAEKWDLVHAQFGQSALLAFPKRLPLVVTYRGSDLLGIVNDADGTYTYRGKVLQRLSKEIARRADAVIVVAEHMKHHVSSAAPTYVVPSGIDLQMFRPRPLDEARRRLGLPLDKRLVLFVGSPTRARKRFDLAVKAFDLLDKSIDAELVVAWKKSHSQIPDYMNACDVLLFTSMQEGSPNVVKEALACNLPVVSVNIGDVPEYLTDIDGCAICADDRPETIADSLDSTLLRGMRVRGRDAVKPLAEHLLTEKVIDIYRSVLA